MARPAPTQKSTSAKSTGGAKSAYLILYNAISAGLWAVVLARTVYVNATGGTKGYQAVYSDVGEWTKWTQTLAGLEVLHAAVGIVRAPLLTTLMQVASRFLLVWGVVDLFPAATAPQPAYSTMLLAWSVTEIIRYSYFAINLSFGGVPAFMTWLRYNTFFVLYPLGISSECWLVWKATTPAEKKEPLLKYAYLTILAIYFPGSYILFTHMMAQRRKIKRGLKAKSG